MIQPIFDATGIPLSLNNLVFCQDRTEDQDGDDLVTTSFGTITAINHNGTVDIKVTHQMCRFIGQHTPPLKRECKSHVITRPAETVIFRNLTIIMLIKQIKSKCLELRKAKSIFASCLQTFIGEVEMVAKNKQQESPTDEQCIATLKRFCDKIDETIGLISDTDKIAALEAEKAIYQQFVPKQLSQTELTEVVKQFVANNPGVKMGQIMAHLKANYTGLYDGKMASDVAKAVLAQ